MTGTVWWTDFCGNRSQYDAFWSPELSLETFNPDVTLCMQKSLLLWIPAAWVLLSAPIYFYILWGRRTFHGLFNFSRLNLFKMVVSAIMTAICIASFTITCNKLANQQPVPPVDVIYDIIRIVTMVLVTALIRLEYMKGFHTSSILCPFWVLYGLLQVLPFKSAFVRRHGQGPWAESKAEFGLDVAFFVLLLAELIASSFADMAALRPTDGAGYSDEKTPLLLDSTALQDSFDLKSANPAPQLSASFWMRTTFLWILPDFLRNYKRTVTFEDLYDIRPQDSCGTLMPTFNKYFTKYFKPDHRDKQAAVRRALYWALFQTIGWPVVFTMLVKSLSTAIILINPQLLSMLIYLIDSHDPYTWKIVMLALVMGLGAFVSALVRHSVFSASVNASLRARNLLNAIVCHKALLLSGAAKRETTVGEMINLLSVDAQKVQEGVTWIQAFLDIPLVTFITCGLIYNSIGSSALVGIAFLVIILPLNGFYSGNKIRQFQEKQMVHKDSRLRVLNEILNGIKILKLYAWENSFMKQVMLDRNGEIRFLRSINLISATSNTVWCLIPYLTALAVFSVHVMTNPDHSLSADSTFVTLAYINSIQMPLSFLPLAVTNTGQGLVSLRRIAEFLHLGELPKSTVVKEASMEDAIQIDEASFSWDSDDGRAVLKGIQLQVKPGELVAVVGQVGAGKSSLLSAILGEMIRQQGQIKVKGEFAYVPQQAWIQNSTLKDNILFDKPFSKKKYKKVLDACSLTRDLEVLPGGDFTEIGEKGINLSGGQKARVSLARAVYQDEDIYLLDDPLSAVDAHVGKHIFEKVIGKKGILRHKARVLVTHAITFLPYVDRIVVMKDGCVSEIGQYDELLENDGAFAEYLRTYLVDCDFDDDGSSASEMLELHQRLSTLSGTESEGDQLLLRNHQTNARQRRGAVQRNNQMSQSSSMVESTTGNPTKHSKLMEEEISQEGQMNPKVILAYIKAGGMPTFIVVVVSLLLFSVAQVLTNIWLSTGDTWGAVMSQAGLLDLKKWTSDEPTNGTIPLEQASYRLGVYGGLGIFQVLTAVSVMMAVGLGCTQASYTLHKTLLTRVLHAPMSFFDTTPLGRIMNRFARDMDGVDGNVPLFLAVWIMYISPAISVIVIISYTTPIFLVVIVGLLVPYIITMRLFILYASQLKRIESVRKSPLYAHFEEMVMGASSIRAYRREAAFTAKAEHLIDDSHKPWFQLNASQRLVGVIMETMASIIIFSAALFAGLQRDQLGAGLVGMSVSYALQLTAMMNTVIRSSQELETYMVSVERIDEYTHIPSEALWTLPSDSSSELWPQDGALNFKGYGTRYRAGLDLVLSGVNLYITPGEKVGVVGRTGAGKSSLTLALFRIIEAAEGQITIDGEDISKLGLHKLRSRLTVIPQDPVMFSGSLRMNLDPAHDYSDHDIWQALERAHLKSFVQGLEKGLDYNCGEGGDAISIGQRQLVCLARALLRRSKILILDEATAAVDLETDALIQASIKKHFDKCTVITVAHRLNTVLDYDKILVLDQGKVKEFDSPENLLASKNSIFYSLAREAGLA